VSSPSSRASAPQAPAFTPKMGAVGMPDRTPTDKN
jgi:hypothetical protein